MTARDQAVFGFDQISEARATLNDDAYAGPQQVREWLRGALDALEAAQATLQQLRSESQPETSDDKPDRWSLLTDRTEAAEQALEAAQQENERLREALATLNADAFVAEQSRLGLARYAARAVLAGSEDTTT